LNAIDRVLECFNETWEGVNAYAHTLVHFQNGQNTTGYLMTIGSVDEQNILYNRLMAPSNVDAFVGGYDADGDSKLPYKKKNNQTFHSSHLHRYLGVDWSKCRR
jgi:hypothetical protein